MQNTSPEIYDVVIIGSGAGGGTVAHVLTAKGVRCALLEAGPMIDPKRDFKEHQWPNAYAHRGVGERAEAYFPGGGFGGRGFSFNANFGGNQLDGEPYSLGDGTQFLWWRSRVVGGRTLHYARNTYRYADYDFKPYDRDGLSPNWPISYDDIAPYYDQLEAFIGVSGSRERIRSAPDGIFQDPPPAKVHEVLLQRACGQLNIPCIPNRLAIITRALNGRPACHYCGQCPRGCGTASNYDSLQVQIVPALKTGRLKLFDMAMAREVVTDGNGRATGVIYVDKRTRDEKLIRGRVIAIAGGTCDTARLLLNSKSKEFPNGLANGSGMVGRNLTNTVDFSVTGYLPSLAGMPRYNSDGYSQGHVFIPWWLWDRHDKLDFPRGYHTEISGGYGMPGIGAFTRYGAQEGFGKQIKETVRREYGCTIRLAGRGEAIPNANSYLEIDPTLVDKWGIPALRFHYKWSDYEWKQAQHMERTYIQIIEQMGGKVIPRSNGGQGPGGINLVSGSVQHDVGAARMRADHRTSVVNGFCQAHEVKNLFLCDGSVFASNADKNPTPTINALAWRASDYMAEEMRRGSI
jgi:choline dehydrogenase-like flavoprotein